jgi:hypothetical protein
MAGGPRGHRRVRGRFGPARLFLWLEWRDDGQIAFIHDCRHARYVVEDAELVLAEDQSPPSSATP